MTFQSLYEKSTFSKKHIKLKTEAAKEESYLS